MNILIHWLIATIAIIIAAFILPGVEVTGPLAALAAAAVLGVINVTIKPILLILTLPINILTLGLFTFVINAMVILLASVIVPGFIVANFGWALLFGLALAALNYILYSPANA